MNRFLVTVAVLLAMQPDGTAASGARLPDYSTSKLPGGLTLLLMEHHEVPLTSVHLILRSGSTRDPHGKEGLAALTADLLRKGTSDRSAAGIASALDFIGATYSASVSHDFTSIDMEFMSKDSDAALAVLADMLQAPVFPAEEVTKLQRQRVEGIRSAKDSAGRVIDRYFDALLFGEHGYGRPAGGTESSLETITRDDVVAFHRTHHVPGNGILAVVGQFRSAEMRDRISRHFGSWKGAAPAPQTLPVFKPGQGRKLRLIDKPDATQTYFQFGNAGVPRNHPDRTGISIVNTLFGGRFTSRLNTALRIKSGLSYGAMSIFDQRSATGSFHVSSYTRNATTVRAIDVALEELQALHRDGITAKELESTKTYLKGQFPTTIETSERLAGMIARFEFFGLTAAEVNEYNDRVDRFTLKDAERIIREHFPLEDLVFVCVGRADDVQDVLKKYAATMDVRPVTAPGYR